MYFNLRKSSSISTYTAGGRETEYMVMMFLQRYTYMLIVSFISYGLEFYTLG